jgi:hypothetical protein
MIRGLTVESKTYRPFDPVKSKGVYVSVIPTAKSALLISKYASLIGMPLLLKEQHELHCTVVYSKYVPKARPVLDFQKVYRAQITGVNWWLGHDKAGYLVLLLKSPDMSGLYRQWYDSGCISSFGEYTPHVTLKKDFGERPPNLQLIRSKLDKYVGSVLEFSSATLEGLSG